MVDFRSPAPPSERVSRDGTSARGQERLDAGMEDRLHRMLVGVTQPGPRREALAETLRVPGGRVADGGHVPWPTAIPVSVRPPAGERRRLPYSLNRDDLQGHCSLSGDLVAAVRAALTAGEELWAVTASGQVTRETLRGKLELPRLLQERADGMH